MAENIILASRSLSRAAMLSQVGLRFEQIVPAVDEDMIRKSLLVERASPRDVADALAEAKARKIGAKRPESLVIGSDQVLEIDNEVLSKPVTAAEACAQLALLSGKTHKLISAAVIYEEAKPVWRHASEARLTVRTLSPRFIDAYVSRNWESIRHSVGGYKIEEEGARIFARIDGNQFTIMGLPLLELVSYLTLRGILET